MSTLAEPAAAPRADASRHASPTGDAPWGLRRSPALPAAVCLGVAVVSLVLPATLAFDPWAWLVWGREVLHLDLDSTGGPSWKPLPVLFATGMAATGDLAPTVWLVAGRTAGLLALVFAFRLAARCAGPAAGAVAAGLVVLTPDGGPRFLRLVTEGHADALSATLCLWAVERHLDGKRAHALVLGTGLALMRPEAWPFLGLYALWLWRREPRRRALIVALLVAVPVLWFGGDWWGSGSPWHGADAAQVVSGTAADRFGLAFERMVKVVVPPAWVLAGVAVAGAWRRRDRVLPALAGGALAWFALVVGMSVALRYAALSRFLLPGAVLLCVLAGIGAVRAVTWAAERAVGAVASPAGTDRRRRRVAVAGAVAVAVIGSLPAVLPRVLAFGALADEIAMRARLERSLDEALDRAGGPDAVLACGRVVISTSDVPRMALAWKLAVPLHDVDRRLRGEPGVVFAQRGGRLDRELGAALGAGEGTGGQEGAAGREGAGGSGSGGRAVTLVARSAEWTVYGVGCPEG
ncbi:MAG TPA: hypothetical protein VIL48_20600 [Acidimicrobiales bacterium]